MPALKSLERILQERKEREERKAEKERIKKEKEEEKKRLKKIEHKKKLKKRQNQKYYKKIRDAKLKEREEKGDKRTYHMVLIMKDYKRKKRIGASWWMTDAYEIYNNAIKENRETVKFPVEIHEGNEKKQKQGERSKKAVYEIMILQRTPEGQEINKFRNKSGKFIPSIIIDDENYTIIAKDEWFMEETFNVFGYHPIKDRKTFDFILNEMVLKDASKDNIKRIFSFHNKLIIQYDNDIDIITCKTAYDAKRLHDTLRKYTSDNKYILYTENVTSRNIAAWVLNKLEEKTGWSRKACNKVHTL